MTTEPKLLTEAEARDEYAAAGLDGLIAELRERGLIADEPVDPLLKEARERVAYRELDLGYRKNILLGKHDNHHAVKIERAALERGREIGLAERPTLTREAVVEIAAKAGRIGLISVEEIDSLHAAILERLS